MSETKLLKSSRIALTILFLLSFGVYAVSPLSYACAAKTKSGALNALSGLGRLNLYILEVVLSRLTDRPDSDDRSDARILLRKIRAVLPDKTSAKLSYSAGLPAVSCASHPAPESFPESADRSIQNKLPTGFNPLYSGHSPPAAA